jgi:hypothetical protein
MDEPRSLGYFTLDSAAIAMHEMYQSLLKAGFTETEAIALVVGLTRE